MKITLFTSFVLLFIGTFCQVSVGDFTSARAVQIVTPVNHTFRLELENLKPILEADDIKDRHVVVVSIAGAFRKGKSFLSNFFIRYLYAQYKTHDVSDWIGANENSSELSGFKWRGGQKPETIGIWMWSDIFTHDFENGEKIAILLLDTQGIFDSQSSLQDCTTTFAMSMMLSSVQCYNVMQNIQENDLHHLELFTEYGRMVLDETNEKPFQYLLFIVRDWPFAEENEYGWGQPVVDALLAENEEQTPKMRQLRQRINSSFDEIGAFLLPYPGREVALKKNFNGNLKQIDPEFIKYVKELVPSIFAPENLILKRINGEKVRAGDLIQYMQAYLNVFNGQTLPEAGTFLGATAEANNLILFNEALDFYFKSMQSALRDVDPYFSQPELFATHEMFKNESLSQYLRKRKLGSDDLISSFVRRIENTTEQNFLHFQQENDNKRKVFIEKANLHNKNINIEIRTDFEKKILIGIEHMELISAERLNQLLESTEGSALTEFNAKKMGGSEISNSFREELQQSMNNFEASVETMMTAYKESVAFYSNLMQTMLKQAQNYAKQSELNELHQYYKTEAFKQFQLRANDVPIELKLNFERKAENEITRKYSSFEQKNNENRDAFSVKAESHNANLIANIYSVHTSSAYDQVNNAYSYFSSSQLWTICSQTRSAALNEYDLRKLGDDDMSSSYRSILAANLRHFERNLESVNDQKRSNYERRHSTYEERHETQSRDDGDSMSGGTKKAIKTGGFTAGGAAVGGVIAGPPGAIIGGIIGAALGFFT